MGPVALAQVLRPLLDKLNYDDYPNLIVGLKSGDDAAVYRINDQLAVIQTVDFFTPIVDDPYTYGAIAAANSMSDVYAMGGEVILALNLAALPEDLPREMMTDIFRGGADKVAEAGGVIAGGHTITDDEPKYGLAVMGFVHPDKVVTKKGARPGDLLLLTKPLGGGIVVTAARADRAEPAHLQEAIEAMLRLNRRASQLMQEVGVNAATDITGFALLGHALEMAQSSRVQLRFVAADIPIFSGALEYARQKLVTGGAGHNRRYTESKVQFGPAVSAEMDEVLHDPQTSGGLLISLPRSRAEQLTALLTANHQPCWLVGEVLEGEGIEVV